MKRRDFLKSVSALPLLAWMPSISWAKTGPTTAEELYDAINRLGTKMSFDSIRAYEEIIYCGISTPLSPLRPPVRYTHETYGIVSKTIKPNTEAKLVKKLWENIQFTFKQHPDEKPEIVWRRKPVFEKDFDFGETKACITMRLSIGCDESRPNFRSFLLKAEGNSYAVLGDA